MPPHMGMPCSGIIVNNSFGTTAFVQAWVGACVKHHGLNNKGQIVLLTACFNG